MNHYIDKTLKTLVDRFSPYYINWILGSSFKLVEKLSTEIPTKTRHADLVYKVKDNIGKQYIFHLEFQASKSKEPMNLRMLGYCVRLVEKYSLHVCGTVLYLTKEAYEQEGDLGYFRVICPDGKEVLTFKYNVIKLWELDGLELLKNKIVGLYPLLGLTKLPEPKENALIEIIKEIKSIKDPILYKDILFSFKVLSGLEINKELLDALIRREDIMESPVLKEIWLEAKKEGKIEGKKEGKLEGLSKSVLSVLRARFNRIPRRVTTKIKKIREYTKLEHLLKLAAISKNLD
ncbi:MAG: Rpn family recombination-promoting nuclease/putative transposase [Methanosarcinales archaeon]